MDAFCVLIGVYQECVFGRTSRRAFGVPRLSTACSEVHTQRGVPGMVRACLSLVVDPALLAPRCSGFLGFLKAKTWATSWPPSNRGDPSAGRALHTAKWLPTMNGGRGRAPPPTLSGGAFRRHVSEVGVARQCIHPATVQSAMQCIARCPAVASRDVSES